MSQDSLKLQHALSRLQLARAIKTPQPGEIDAEPWTKSIIFNQPYVQDLLKRKQQLDRRDRKNPKPQSRRQSHSSLKLENKMSKLSLSGSVASLSNSSQRGCLPSDTEEEEEEDEEDDEEDEDDDKEEEDVSEVTSQQQRPFREKSLPKINDFIRDSASSSSTSRGSTASSVSPLTDEDEVPLPPPSITLTRAESWKPNPPQEYRLPKLNDYTQNQPIPIEMMDPMYYQRMQQYQLQLQLQYQQAIMMQQQQQQQQAYFRTQTPLSFLPPGTPVPPPRDNKRHAKNSKRQQQQTTPPRSTDLRRRAEMLRNASEFASQNQQPVPYSAYPYTAFQSPNMRFGGRPNYYPI